MLDNYKQVVFYVKFFRGIIILCLVIIELVILIMRILGVLKQVKKFKNGKNDIKFILHLDDKKDNLNKINLQTLIVTTEF